MTSATATIWPEDIGRPTRVWRRFRAWRRTRPFWGGLLAVFAGVPILYFPYAHLRLGDLTVAMATTAGAGSLVIGVLLMVLGVSAWFQPVSRVFCGIAVTILTLISIPVSNLGGFLMGLIPGLIAGGLLCAWSPLPPEQAAAMATRVMTGSAQAGEPAPAEAQPAEPTAEPAAAQPVAAEPVAVEEAAPAAHGTPEPEGEAK
ncbi:hypothetical protein C7C46_16435 [Streptomyces tateyamensis]|uniref:Integral membrane protein n=1 Tax=Streptomyces tateyamensis TaxID=565073 RepID=A0A2V4NR20_9ACTN|nr:DUF6114 domain-containing protein [Streptomyces tateyamensis]PYC78420.1 hypothetical protein C7C46_16435 [Streptomyces tateyamensis]